MPTPRGTRTQAFAGPSSAVTVGLVPLAALIAAAILIPLAMFGDYELAQSLRGQADARLVTVAKRYSALGDVVVRSMPVTGTHDRADSAQRVALQGVFATGSVSEIAVELLDSAGRFMVGSRTATQAELSAYAAAARAEHDTVFSFEGSEGPQRGAFVLANEGNWRVLAHESVDLADSVYRPARAGLFAGAAFLFLIVLGIAFAVDRLINRRIRQPATELAGLAESVAAGDLTVQVTSVRSTDEIERLARALASMVAELARLARGLTESARETSAMSAEITASTEEMAASAGEIAHTASDLSTQSGSMAEGIQALASSAAELVSLAERLDAGAHEGVARNAQLRSLALENRGRLDQSSRALDALTMDVQSSADAVTALAEASQEIKSFVALVQRLARQSKLLALNAAMEAARAGDQGEGFAVVAAEVRRLSTMSSDAAARTQQVVHDILAGVETSRASADRTVATARDVRSATEQGSASFGEIEDVVAATESWTGAIEQTAMTANALVRDMTGRLDGLSRGTESFAAAMEEVAASSEEQSATTQEIAAAAATLAHAAERLSTLVANLHIGDVASVRRSGPAVSRTSQPTTKPALSL